MSVVNWVYVVRSSILLKRCDAVERDSRRRCRSTADRDFGRRQSGRALSVPSSSGARASLFDGAGASLLGGVGSVSLQRVSWS